jgi:transposase
MVSLSPRTTTGPEDAFVKSPRERLDILAAFRDLGTFRAAAALCGTTDKTVKRIILRQQQGPPQPRPPRRRNTAVARDVVREKVASTDGRISAKRLLPLARAAGYAGSARNFRRLVHDEKQEWRRRRRVYRPWLPTPGEHLVIDWGQLGPLHIFSAVLVWSRIRFVRFALREDRATTLRLLAECFEELGGVPAVVLADRMACLRAGIVANVVVPHPEYVRFASHFGFRPDFCESHDPESKGVVENLVGYAKRDLVIPLPPASPSPRRTRRRSPGAPR